MINTECIMVYATCKDNEQAKQIGSILVKERLCACANIYSSMESIYHWKGSIQNDKEATLILKTTNKMFKILEARIKALHTYDNPCVISIPILDGSEEYLQWIKESVKKE